MRMGASSCSCSGQSPTPDRTDQGLAAGSTYHMPESKDLGSDARPSACPVRTGVTVAVLGPPAPGAEAAVAPP